MSNEIMDKKRGIPFSIGEKVIVYGRPARISDLLAEGRFEYVQIERKSGQKTYVVPSEVHFDPR